ncbi:MAG: hypothetical protein WCK57_10170 [Verrucomicrobiae bacterium]
MSKKTSLLIVVAVVLAAVYAFYFADWFQSPTLKIFHTNRNNIRHRKEQSGGIPNLIFGLSQTSRITEITVVPLAEYQVNSKVIPLWHLVSDSNSVPVKTFYYGQYIRGLKPAVAGSHAQTLTNNITYRIVVSVGKIKGEHDFELK